MSFKISAQFRDQLKRGSYITDEIAAAVYHEIFFKYFREAARVITKLVNEVLYHGKLQVLSLATESPLAVEQVLQVMSSLPIKLAVEQHFGVSLLYRETHGLAAYQPLEDHDLSNFLHDGQPYLDSQSVGAGPLLSMAFEASKRINDVMGGTYLQPWSSFANSFHRRAVYRFAADVGVAASLAHRYSVAFCCLTGGPGVVVYSAFCETDTHGHRTVRPRLVLNLGQLLYQQLCEGSPFIAAES